MDRITQTFAATRDKGKACFISYLCAGDPDFRTSVEVCRRLHTSDVDIIELGVPFSDPLADGVPNQLAAQRALESGMTRQKVTELVADLREFSDKPVILYTYYNLVFSPGVENYVREMKEHGVDDNTLVVFCSDNGPGKKGSKGALSGFKGSLAEFFKFLRTDERFYYKKGTQLLAGYRDISKRADPELIKLFGRLPRQPYGVRPVPSYIERSVTTAYYQPGSTVASRPGYFYANTFNLAVRPKWEMEALTLHEAVPGHHLQLAIADELTGLPTFRKYNRYTAYVEGWALYAESLGTEMGFYKDPYSKFGQLTYEMWRAIRLVVDTGMHALGWSRQRAIDYFKTNAGKTEHDIIVEVDRYIVWPGQALAYKMGELKIKSLRDRAEKVLGDKFDIRGFHDELLRHGAIPLGILGTQVEAWIARQAAK